jgi:hypothetical protein
MEFGVRTGEPPDSGERGVACAQVAKKPNRHGRED